MRATSISAGTSAGSRSRRADGCSARPSTRFELASFSADGAGQRLTLARPATLRLAKRRRRHRHTHPRRRPRPGHAWRSRRLDARPPGEGRRAAARGARSRRARARPLRNCGGRSNDRRNAGRAKRRLAPAAQGLERAANAQRRAAGVRRRGLGSPQRGRARRWTSSSTRAAPTPSVRPGRLRSRPTARST